MTFGESKALLTKLIRDPLTPDEVVEEIVSLVQDLRRPAFDDKSAYEAAFVEEVEEICSCYGESLSQVLSN